MGKKAPEYQADDEPIAKALKEAREHAECAYRFQPSAYTHSTLMAVSRAHAIWDAVKDS
jgi:hypothetical protein